VTDWPVSLRGITESIVSTPGPGGMYNVAALGLHAPDQDGAPPDVVTARTWGRTRTRRNFGERGRGYVQFTRDAVDFVDAALAIREVEEPILSSADAWVEVSVDRIDSGEEGDTTWVDWALHPEDAQVERQVVPTTNRGLYAVVEATIAASRLDVEAYDTERLQERLEYFETVALRCGGPREREAIDRLNELLD
jgi:hypothetical protein